jgi:hypothetical protein
MKTDPTKALAERIAKVIESESQNPELASIFAALEKINHRLDKLELGPVNLVPEIADKGNHASLDKFNVAEAIADRIFSHYKKEKACQFEPGRPCDHCSMCNSRGF